MSGALLAFVTSGVHVHCAVSSCCCSTLKSATSNTPGSMPPLNRYWSGNYSAFVEARTTAYAAKLKQIGAMNKQKKHLEDSIVVGTPGMAGWGVWRDETVLVVMCWVRVCCCWWWVCI